MDSRSRKDGETSVFMVYGVAVSLCCSQGGTLNAQGTRAALLQITHDLLPLPSKARGSWEPTPLGASTARVLVKCQRREALFASHCFAYGASMLPSCTLVAQFVRLSKNIAIVGWGERLRLAHEAAGGGGGTMRPLLVSPSRQLPFLDSHCPLPRSRPPNWKSL